MPGARFSTDSRSLIRAAGNRLRYWNTAVTALLKLIPWWVWAGGAILAALVIQDLRIRYLKADIESKSSQLAEQQARTESLQATLRLQRGLTADAAAIDKQYTKVISDAKAENDQLRADIAAGRRRVSVNATCVRDAADTGAAGSTDAGTPRLTPDAEQARADLEYAVERQRQQVIGLQAYIRSLLARLNSRE